MTTKLTGKKVPKYYFFFAVTNTILLPLVPFFFGESYLNDMAMRGLSYVVILLTIILIWFVGIKLLHLDDQGPIPWYASPVVWLGPGLLVMMYFMFS